PVSSQQIEQQLHHVTDGLRQFAISLARVF
ncbi:MAG: hypothetical protein ACI90V_012428, partial [Bacillariaceae sp.]